MGFSTSGIESRHRVALPVSDSSGVLKLLPPSIQPRNPKLNFNTIAMSFWYGLLNLFSGGKHASYISSYRQIRVSKKHLFGVSEYAISDGDSCGLVAFLTLKLLATA
jgi:hypothetical protein